MSVVESIRRDEAGRTVVALRGEHDASNAAELSSELDRALTVHPVAAPSYVAHASRRLDQPGAF